MSGNGLRLHVAVGVFFVVTLLSTALIPAPAQPPKTGQTPAPSPPRLDRYGDPLPAGAVMRLGEARLRPGARITRLAFTNDGKRLVSWGNESPQGDRVSVWNTSTGRELNSVTPTTGSYSVSTLLTADRALTVVPNAGANGLAGHRLVTVPLDSPPPAAARPVVRRSPVMATAITPAAPMENFVPLDLSSDGKELYLFHSKVLRQGVDSASPVLHVYEAKPCSSLTDLRRLKIYQGLPTKAVTCTGLAVRPGVVVVLTQMDGRPAVQEVTIFDTKTAAVRTTFTAPLGTMQGTRQSFDVSPDGTRMAIGLSDGTVVVFDTHSGKKLLEETKHHAIKDRPAWAGVSALKFVLSGKAILSAGRDQTQLVWDVESGRTLTTLNGHKSWVEAIAISPDGRTVATAGQDSLIRLWDTTTWQPLLPPRGHFQTIWNLQSVSGGRFLLSEATDETARLWDMSSGEEVRSWPTAQRGQSALPTPDGSGVLIQEVGDTVLFHPVLGGPGRLLAVRGTPLAFSPDGRMLATQIDAQIRSWSWPEGTALTSAPLPNKASCVAFLPDGRLVARGNTLPTGERREVTQFCRIIDLATGKLGAELELESGMYRRSLIAAPDGDTLFVCTMREKSNYKYSLARQAVIKQFERPEQSDFYFYQIGFALSPNGAMTATGANDGSIILHETATGQIRSVLRGHRQSVIALAFSPDGKKLYSGGPEQSVLVWDVSLPALGRSGATAGRDLHEVWEALGTASAKDALPLLADLQSRPQEAASLIRDGLPVAPNRGNEGLKEKLDRIFRELDARDFATRRKASQELSSLGPTAWPDIRRRLDATESAEVRTRVSVYFAETRDGGESPETIREQRALELLENIGIPEAREVLTALAKGDPLAQRTIRATQALGRLTK
jgi:WD40 repeat protein